MTNTLILTVTHVRLEEQSVAEFAGNRRDYDLGYGRYTNLDFEHEASGVRLQLSFDHQQPRGECPPWVTVRRGLRETPGIFRDFDNVSFSGVAFHIWLLYTNDFSGK